MKSNDFTYQLFEQTIKQMPVELMEFALNHYPNTSPGSPTELVGRLINKLTEQEQKAILFLLTTCAQNAVSEVFAAFDGVTDPDPSATIYSEGEAWDKSLQDEFLAESDPYTTEIGLKIQHKS